MAGATDHITPPDQVFALATHASTPPELVTRLAALPAREALLAQLGGVLQAPLAAFAGAMNGLFMTMVGALEALKHNKAGA